MTAISDSNAAAYSATVTCDDNANITDIVETVTSTQPNAFYSHYEYDHFNRITQYQTKQYDTTQSDWLIKEHNHQYDALGRLVRSDYTEYLENALALSLGTTYEVEHMYTTSGQHLGNYDGSSTYGTAWAWAGAANSHGGPLYGPNADTAAWDAYNVAQGGGGNDPQRWT